MTGGHSSPIRARTHGALWVFIGLTVGAILGTVGTCSALAYGVWKASTRGASVVLDPVVSVVVTNEGIYAESGNGLVLPTLVAAILGALVAGLLWVLHSRVSTPRSGG